MSTTILSGGKLCLMSVAGRAFVQLRFAPTASGVSAFAPCQALSRLSGIIETGGPVAAVDITGPGDPLADISTTLEVIGEVHRRWPEIAITVTSLGLNGADHAAALREAGAGRMNLLVDCVENGVAKKVYAWIRSGNKTVPLSRAAAWLVEEQARVMAVFRRAGIGVSARCRVFAGINDGHVDAVARFLADHGVERLELAPGNDECCRGLLAQARQEAGRNIPTTICDPAAASDPAVPGAGPTGARPNVAVVSGGGVEVDLHLGRACRVLIYGPRRDGLVCLLATRDLPDPGGGEGRWRTAAEALSDCFVLLTASAGPAPCRIFGRYGISVVKGEGEIEVKVDALYDSGRKRSRP